MKLKLAVVIKPGDEPIIVRTNLLCITEWERTERRKMSDGLGIGAGDMVSWAYFMLKQSGMAIKETTSQEWHRNNPDLDIEGVDETDANPTAPAPIAGN